MDAITPTPQQLKRFQYEPPEQTQTTNRRCYRRISEAQRLNDKGQIDGQQHSAFKKVERHVLGATGVDVRSGDPPSDVSLEAEEAKVYHAQKKDEMHAVCSERSWKAILLLVADATLNEIGTEVSAYKDRGRRAAVALTLIEEGLEAIVELYGLR